MDRTRKSRLFQSLKAVRRRKGKIGAVFLLGIFALMLVGSMGVAVSGNEVSLSYSPIELVKNFQIAASEEIWIDTFGNDIDDGWTLTGADPYLAAQDQPTNQVSVTSTGGSGSDLGYFHFGSTSLTSITDVNISIYHNTAENTRITIYNSTHSETINLGNSGGGWAWETITAGATDELELWYSTDTEINAAYILLNAKSQGGSGLVTIDAAKMGIEGTSTGGNNYEEYYYETVSAVDVQTNAADFDRDLTESVSAVDVQTNAADFVRNLLESIGVVGIISIAKVTTKNMTETISAADVLTNTGSFVRGYTESVSIVDAIAKAVGINMTEAISAVDTIDIFKLAVLDLFESISASDVRTTAADYVRNRTESISAIDAQSNAAAYVRDFVEAITAADVLTNTGTFVRDLVETIIVIEIIDAGIVGQTTLDLNENITVSQVLGTEGGTPVTYSLFYELFFSREMWGYLGPIGLVISGYVVANKERILGVLFFVVECLFISHYLTLVEATPDYWWQVFILLIGGMLTIAYAAWDR